jgi:hypothetical protein
MCNRRMSMLTFAVRDPRINRDRLMKICLVHDLAESIVGDITPHCGVSKEEKRVLEEVSFCFTHASTVTMTRSNGNDDAERTEQNC